MPDVEHSETQKRAVGEKFCAYEVLESAIVREASLVCDMIIDCLTEAPCL